MLFQDTQKFKNVDIRAGMTATSRNHQGSSANLITDSSPLIVNYVGPAGQGEIVTITFPTPILAQYILFQVKNLNSNLQMAEMKVIECKKHHNHYNA